MRKLYRYHAQATSVAGFLQVLTANYLPAGCVFYFQGGAVACLRPGLQDKMARHLESLA